MDQNDDFNPTPYPDPFPSVFEDNCFEGSLNPALNEFDLVLESVATLTNDEEFPQASGHLEHHAVEGLWMKSKL
ncbi:hypothetical protein LTS15_001694 [Exophiala xenobiotica]|nr:hypothetical protein LTS15_001694 [Exophiala xenobiotica]